jgi:hypothetical protein
MCETNGKLGRGPANALGTIASPVVASVLWGTVGETAPSHDISGAIVEEPAG